MDQIEQIIKELKKYSFSTAVVKHKSEYKVLVAAMLSARTRDENTEKAVERLFSKYDGVGEIAQANVKELEELVKSTGFYRVKARNLKELSRILVEEYKGKVPKELGELKKLPGVGQKVAQCVRVYAFGEDALPVDTHVHRISNRIGLVKTKGPEKTERELLKKVPRKYWKEINNLLVKFGQNICKPIKPKCEGCGVNKWCEYYKNTYT